MDDQGNLIMSISRARVDTGAGIWWILSHDKQRAIPLEMLQTAFSNTCRRRLPAGVHRHRVCTHLTWIMWAGNHAGDRAWFPPSQLRYLSVRGVVLLDAAERRRHYGPIMADWCVPSWSGLVGFVDMNHRSATKWAGAHPGHNPDT